MSRINKQSKGSDSSANLNKQQPTSTRRNTIRLLGWLLFLVGVGIFCMESGFLVFHEKYTIEHIDQRLFYLLNILCIICLITGCYLCFTFTKRIKQISLIAVIIFSLLHLGLLFDTQTKINHVIRFSPDYKHVLIIKEDIDSGQAIYHRSLYGIFSRPHTSLPGQPKGEFKIDWLANDVVAVTYKTRDDTIQQYIGTYGDRGNGHYYYVGSEIAGHWEGDRYEVSSDTAGITVIDHGNKELFTWENIEQFGTLAIVLKKDNHARWTIALNENFTVQNGNFLSGNISLYQATMENNQPIILQSYNPVE